MSDAVTSAVSIDAARCTGCKACLNSCPTDVFGFDEMAQKAMLAYPQDCSVCFLCIGDCPSGAIKIDYAITGGRKHSAYEAYDAGALVLDVSTFDLESQS